MSAMIQIRNVPDGLHRKLKSRAALAGLSLSEYLLRHVKSLADQPTREELIEKMRRLPRISLPESPADIVREERDRR